jgi:hypothetical protein
LVLVYQPLADEILAMLPWGAVVRGLVREVVVVAVDSLAQGDFEVKGVVPFVGPDQVFFDGAHDAFGIGVALWV